MWELNRVPFVLRHASMVYLPTCQTRPNFSFVHVNVLINLPTCLRCANYSILSCQRAKGVPISQNRLPKSVPIFQLFFKRFFQFLNFSIMLNIWKFQEYLGKPRKLISRNKESKFWQWQNFIKEKPPKIFDVVFNGPCGISQTINRLVWNGAEYFF